MPASLPRGGPSGRLEAVRAMTAVGDEVRRHVEEGFRVAVGRVRRSAEVARGAVTGGLRITGVLRTPQRIMASAPVAPETTTVLSAIRGDTHLPPPRRGLDTPAGRRVAAVHARRLHTHHRIPGSPPTVRPIRRGPVSLRDTVRIRRRPTRRFRGRTTPS